MHVFIVGATGYIGSTVVEHLRRAGHEISGLARSDIAASKLERANVRVVRGEMRDAAIVSKAASEADGVSHMATTGGPDARDADTALVRAVLEALDGTGKPFIYTSGVWVHGDTAERTVDEDSPLHSTELVAWRVACEAMVLDAVERQVRTVVIRPAIVYGRGDGIPVSWVESARKGGAARYVGTGENHWPLVHVEDLAEGYRLALEKAKPGSVFILSNGPSVRVLDLAQAASHGAGAGGRVQSWPLPEARRVLGAYADALALDQHVSADRAKTVLGWSPSGPSAIEDLARGSYVKAGGT